MVCNNPPGAAGLVMPSRKPLCPGKTQLGASHRVTESIWLGETFEMMESNKPLEGCSERVLPRPNPAVSGAIKEAGNVSAKLLAGPGSAAAGGEEMGIYSSKRTLGLKDPAILHSYSVWVHEEETGTGKKHRVRLGELKMNI